MIGSFFTKAKNKHEKTFAAAGKAINEKLRQYAKVGSALIDAREKGCDPFSAIETVVPWDVFLTSVREAEQLARDEDFDSIGLIVEHYGQLRRYAPTFLETFEFRAAPAAQEIIEGIEILRELNRTNTRNVPPPHRPVLSKTMGFLLFSIRRALIAVSMNLPSDGPKITASRGYIGSRLGSLKTLTTIYAQSRVRRVSKTGLADPSPLGHI
jgi:hypothetical protein